MVTIVNGSALGLQSSLLGTRSNVGSNVQGQNPNQVYVNSATGNLVVQDQDELLSSIGSGLSIVRTYNSQGTFGDPVGNNWSLSVNQFGLTLTGTVNTAGSTIVTQFGDGSQVTYTYNATLGLYTDALGNGPNNTISYNSSTGLFTWTDGQTRATQTYDGSSGLMMSSADSSGNVTTYTYNGVLLTRITDPSGQMTNFDYSGNNLVDIREVSNGVTQKRVQYAYDTSNRLSTVSIDLTPANGASSDPTYVTTYTYQGTTDLLASITQGDGTKVSFQYVNNNGGYQVAQVIDGNGKITSFSYSGSAGAGPTEYLAANANPAVLSTASPPLYTVPSGATWASIAQAVYGATDPNAVAQLQSDLGNPSLTAGLQLAVPLQLFYISQEAMFATTTVTDALGNISTYTQEANTGRLTSVATPLTRTNYTYDTNGNLRTTTQDPSGLNATTTYTYDSNGNLLSSVDAAGDTVTYTYNTDNQLLTKTEYLVPASGSTAASAPITTRYVYDGNDRLRFAISAIGDVTEYRYNALGQRANQLVYGGADIYNITGLGASTAPTLAQLTSWAAGLSQTQNQSIERTDYTYDFRGNLSTATLYTATSTTGAGAGTASTTQYIYDQRGLLLQVIDPRGIANTANASNSSLPYATTYTYDGLGRVLSKTRWAATAQGSAVTVTSSDVYNGSTIQTTSANGLVTTSVYDKVGHLISVAHSGTGSQSLGTTTYQYDADGRLAITTDPTGAKQYLIYDANARQVGEVDVSGDGNGAATLTQYIYDPANERVKTVRYADYLSAATVATLTDSSGQPASVSIATLVAALPVAVGRASDQITRSVYDAAWRRVYDIDAAGNVTKYAYDGAGRLTSQIQYATPVTIAATVDSLSPSQVVVTTSPGNDRQTSYFYDNDGRQIGKLDARGYLTQSLYDAAGQIIETIAYAVAAPTASYTGGQWSNLPAASFAQDEVSAYFYDAEGRLVGSFSSAGANTAGTAYAGYFTQTQYDTNNNIASVTQYAQSLTYTAGTSTGATMLAAAQAAAAVQGATAPHVTSYQYDGLNRVTQQTNFEGTVTNYVYDNAGHLISQTVAVGSTITNDTRTTLTRYDLLGRVTAQLSAAGSALLTGNLTQAQIDAIWAQYGTSYTYDNAGRRTSQTVTAYNSTTGTTQTETTQYFYNAAGQLRFTMNALGEVVENQYNALGQVTAQISYYNRVSNPAALSGGLLTSTALTVLAAIANAAKDKKTGYTYKISGKLATQTSAEGGSVTYAYDAFGEQSSSTTVVDSTRGINLVRNFFYDQDGDLFREQSDPTGANQVLTYAYDAFDRQISVTDQYGNKTSTRYDPLGRVIAGIDAVTNAANGSSGTATSTQTTYDAFSRVLTTTDAFGNTTQYKYDDVARSVTVISPEGVSVTTVHNRNGQTLTVTSATNTTSYTYNLNGEVSQISDSAGPLETRQYDSAGREVSSTDANSTITTFSYDAANRVLIRTVDPSGLNLRTSYTYDGEGRVTSTTSANGVVTTTQYDRDGRVSQVAIDPTGLNIVTQYNYNNEGDVVTLTQGLGSSNPRVTQYTYDALGRRTTAVVDPGTGNNPATGQPRLNLNTQYFYDANSNLTHKIDANGNSTWYVYDADNRVHYTVNALGGITETDYNGSGLVIATLQYATAMTPPAATVHQLTVTPTISNADRLSRHYYDRDGREVYTIDAAGSVTQRTYNTDGEVIQLRVINGIALTGTYATTAAVTTALGSAATTLGAADRVQWTGYDARGRAILNVDALGYVTQTQYDGDGNVVASTAYATPITPPAALVTSLSASVPVSGPPQIILNGNSTINVASSPNDRLTRYWYDTAGRQVFTLSPAQYLTKTQYNDATYTQTVTVYAARQSIPTSATTSQLQNGGVAIATSAGSNLSTPPGAVVVVGADQTTTTFLDAAGRVRQVTDALGHSESYTYDALGNKLTYTNKNQQIWTYKYDAGGRLIEEDSPYVSVTNVTASGSALTATPVTASIVTLMAYDGLGNVRTLTEGIEGLSNGTRDTTNSRVTSYGYDALGRQTSVTLPSTPVYNGISSDTVVSQSGAVIGSNSTVPVPPLTTQVVYDTLGNEIASRDAANNWTYKVYDQLGRVVYQIDALSFVTGYTYDAFGNQRTTTRYNTALSTTATGGTTASITGGTLLGLQVTSTSSTGATITATNKNGASSVTSQLYVVAASGQDRTITTSYDLDNRVSQVTQPAVFSFNLATNGSGGQQPAFTAAPTVQYAYNAFGQVVRTATLINPTGTASWAYSFAYYDQAGNKTADINADGYLTTYQYDAEGNLTNQYEYAQALTVNGATSTATAPAGTPTANDRQTQYQYDQLSRKVAKSLLGVQYLTQSGLATGNATTFYGYDALGNQTSITANGGTAYTYYDVLGRVIATVGPAPGDSSSPTPLTLMQVDVYGNLVAQTQYAAGLTSTSVNITPTTASTAPDVNRDRTTLYLRDVEGHALETEQLLTSVNSGEGNTINNIYTFDAYDARGNLVKQYQPANNADTLVTFYTYDALGRETDVISPKLVGSASQVSDQFTDYDAFGEVKGKGVVAYGAGKVDAETFYYDQAGRLFLTNSSGAYTAYLYDLAGNATGMFQEQTAVASAFPLANLSTQSSAAGAYAAYSPSNTGGLLFTQTRYDAMGKVLETFLPTYSSPNAIEAMTNTGVQVQTFNGTTYLTWFAPADSTLTPTLYIDGAAKSFQQVSGSSGTGNEYGYQAEYALTGLPNGPHSYLIQYTRPTLDINGNPVIAGQTTGTFNVGQSLTPIVISNPGTVSSVSAALSGTNLLVSWIPDNISVVPTFSILVGGTWQSVTAFLGEGGVASASLAAPGPGTYQYRITDTLTGATEAQGTGTLTITGATTNTSLGVSAGSTGTVTGISASVSGSTTTVSWLADSGVTSASFQILIGGTWASYTPTVSESGVYSVSLPLPAAGTYQYLIADQVQGMTEAQATGSIAFTASSSSLSLTNSTAATGTVSSVSSSVSGSTVSVGWLPDVAGTSSTFAILIGGTWTNYTPTLTESGAYTVSFPLPAAGTYQYRITDFANGVTEAQGTGSISFTAATSSTSLTNSTAATGTVNSVASSVSGSTVSVGWLPDVAGTSSTFAILIGGTWTNFTPTLTESGAYTVSFPLPAAGTYQYRITDFANGVTEAQGTGNISFTAATSSTSTTGSSTASAPWTTPLPVTASAGVGTQGSGTIVSSASPVQSPIFGENGQVIGHTDSWSGTDTVSLTWLNLASGSYTLNIFYNTVANASLGISSVAASRSFAISGGSSGSFSWTDAANTNSFFAGGISSLSFFQILQGSTVVRDSRSAGVTTTTISWAAPSDTSYVGTLFYRVSGTSAYTGVAASRSGTTFQVSLGQLAPGTYDYIVEDYQNSAESPVNLTQASGQFVVGSNSASISSQNGTPGYLSGVAVSGSNLTWARAMQSGDTLQVQIVSGGTTFTLSPGTSDGTNYAASFNGLPSGTYSYNISYIHGGSTYLQGTGTLSINTTTTNTPATSSIGTPTQLAAVTGFANLGNGVLGWSTASNAGDTIVFHYKASGASSWAGTLAVSGSSPSYSVSLSGLSGNIDYEVDYIASGAAQPYKVGRGTVTLQTTTTPATSSISAPTELSAVSGFADRGNGVFGWSSASNSGDSVVFHYKPSGASAWSGTLTVSGSSPSYSVSLSGLSGSIDYEVDYTASGAAQPYKVGRGTVTIQTITTPATASVGTPTGLLAVSGVADRGNGILGWNTASNTGDTIVFHYKAAGASAWAGTLAVSGSSPSYSVNLSGLSGTISYEIDYIASGATQPYRVGWGAVTITRTTSPGTASASAPVNLSAVSGFQDLGNGVLGWSTAANSGDTIQFHYKAAGASSWAGTLPVSGTGPYSVNLAGLSGVVAYEVDYIASGAAQPYRVETGTVTISTSISAPQDTTASLLPPTPAAPHELQTLDRWGNILSSTDTAQQTTSYTYNSYNEVLTTTDPSVTAVAVAMSSDGTRGTVTTTRSATPTSYNYYDLYGRLIQTKDADGNINSRSYNLENQLISTQDADGGQTTYVYDAFGDQIQITTNVDAQTRYKTLNAYDQAGHLTDIEQELAANTFTAAMVTGFASSLLPASNVNVIRTQYQYDQAGRRIATVDGAGATTRTAYDLHGNVISTTTALGATTTYGYDLQDHKTSVRDPNGNQQSWSYDYFNRLLQHTDLGGTVVTYTYDTTGSGLLTHITSTGGQFAPQNQSYSYDGANHLVQINDTGVNSTTTYSYDAAGRVERQQTSDGGLLAEDTSTQYDAMGRIANISGLGYSVSYSYDAAGNRTNILAYYTTGTGSVSQQNFWYGYDKMNRVQISEGANTNGSIAPSSSQGTILTYDWRGDRTSATTQATNFATEFLTTESGTTFATFGTSTGMAYYAYTYDGAGRLTDTTVRPLGTPAATPADIDARQYDKASRITQETTLTVTKGVQGVADNTPYFDQQTNHYNADGTLQSTLTTRNGHEASYVNYGQVVNESGQIVNGYDAAGNLIGYQVSNFDPTSVDSSNNSKLLYTSQDTFTYARGNSYLESSQAVVNQSAQGTAPGNGTTNYAYNADQQLIQFTDSQKSANNRAFLNNANGQVLTVALGTDGRYGTTGSSTTTYGSDPGASAQFGAALMAGNAFFQANNAQYFFYDSHGNSVGTFGELAGKLSANFDVNFTPISQQYPAQEPPQYVVQIGDSLASIAARIYGDASLWYIIAQANGLTGEGPGDAPALGTALTLPNVVVALPNSAQSFKPFSISQALGDTTPYQPPPPPPHAGGNCGVLGSIFAAIVTAVATYFSWGILTTAVAAAFADALGQEADIALGNQQSFSWAQVAETGIAAGVTAGLGEYAAGAEDAIGISNPAAQLAVNAAIGNAVSQGVAIGFGDQKGFNWMAVAASAAAAPIAAGAAKGVSDWVGKELGSAFVAGFAGQFTAGEINSIAVTTASGGKINTAQVAADAFANAIGNSFAQAVAAPPRATSASTPGSSGGSGNQYGQAGQGQLESNTYTAAGSASSAQAAPLTSNLDLETLRPTLQEITFDANSISAPYIVQPGDSLSTIAGTSNPAVIGEMMRENGLSGSTIYPGEVINLPSGNFQPGDELSGQTTLNHDNARLDALLQPVTVTAQRIALDLSAGPSPVQISTGTTGGVTTVTRGVTLPEFDNSSYFAPGFIASSYYSAEAAAEDSNNSIGNRLVNGTLAIASAPMALVEEIGRGILNIPYMAQRLGQDLAVANLTNDTDTKVLAYLDAISSGATAFNSAGGVVAPFTAAESAALPTSQVSLQSADSWAAARATYTAEGSGPAGSILTSAPAADVALDVGGNAAHSAYQFELLKLDLLRQEVANPGELMSGPVVLRDPVAGATPAQVAQIRQYADIANLSIDEGYMSPTGRVSTEGQLRTEASAAAAEERAAAQARGTPYTGVAGHGPDTTWTGNPNPPFWLDMDPSINSSLGRQAQNYPIGYTPTRFIYEGDLHWTGNGRW